MDPISNPKYPRFYSLEIQIPYRSGFSPGFCLPECNHFQGMKTNRAGGCLNHKETFLQNPQYRFDIDCDLNDTREIIVQLSQRDARTQIMERKDHFVIGFCILKVEDNRKYR